MRTIGTITNEGYSCKIIEEDDKRVHFIADADIDADGANGQNGGPPAYKADDSGTELLANGGMRIVNGKVICAKPWARNIVILGSDNEPKVFPGGMIASITWYRHPGKPLSDPAAYVDSETVPYIVVPPIIIQKTEGIVRGCKARATWKGRSVECVVADRGPANKIGELSIAAARAIGLPSSPRNGGTEEPEVLYELWPGVAAPGYTLQPA
jgi:Fungal chitosanase of glycosyl hydrolase group 75